MAAEGKQIILFGMLGVGGYLVYEYMQYSNQMSALATQYGVGYYSGSNVTAAVSQLEAVLSFMTYVAMKWGMGGTVTVAQQNVFDAMTGVTTSPTQQAPGTTSPSQPVSVTAVPAPTAAPPASTSTPTPSSLQTLAANMAGNINMTVASADQWNYAFSHVIGQNIDQKYGFSFDKVYGPITGPATKRVRNNGATMSALMFLQLAAAAVPGGLPGLSGFGAIARFSGPVINSVGNMIYQAHHPLPYAPTYTLRGLGAVTQAMGFEKALFANHLLRSNRVA
jgi:hypothetical protein